MNSYITSFLQYLAANLNLSKNTISSYNNDISHLIIYLQNHKINIQSISIKEIEEYFISLNNICTSSMRRKISSLNQFFKFLILENIIHSNPINKMQKPKIRQKIPHTISQNDIETMLQYLQNQNDIKAIRAICIINLLFASGARISEIVEAKLDAVSFIDKSQYLIQPILNLIGKGNKERIVPIHQKAVIALQEYLKVRNKFTTNQKNQYLFPAKNDKFLSRIIVAREIKNVALKSGLNPSVIHPHAFRHSIALKLLNNGMDIRLIQEFLGHKDISTTSRYTNISYKEVENILKTKHSLGKMHNK